MNAGSELIRALEGVWACIQERHPEVPEVLFITGSGDKGGERGHFGPNRWCEAASPSSKVHELFVAGERIGDGPEGVLETLLHEAAHALAQVRGVKDTSRQGRYHNARFQALGEELGLVVERHSPSYGLAATTLPPLVAEAYEPELVALRMALKHHYASYAEGDDPNGTDSETPRKPTPRYECGCPRVIRMSATTYEEGGIVCQLCDEPFAPVVDEA